LPSVGELDGDEETGELPVFEDDVSDDESNEVEDNEEEQDHLLVDVARDAAEDDNEHAHDRQDSEDPGEEVQMRIMMSVELRG
jgi:hypothetical protein